MIPGALAARIRAVARELPGGIAVFDADGTLWREDVGEAFLRHLVSLGWVRLPNGGDPYAAYERAVERDRAAGYAFAAQLQAGLAAAEVAEEAARFAVSWVPPRLLAGVTALREICARDGLSPLLVSASPLPIVLAAGPLAGFPEDRCRGIEVRIRDGSFTTEVIQPITFAAGKVAIARQEGPIALACGDSIHGDLALLESAPIAVAVAPPSGSALSSEAQRRGWFILDG